MIASTLVALGSATAQAEGIAARFGAMRAVAGSPLVLRVQVEDDVGAVARVLVGIRVPSRDRTLTVEALPTGAGGWWHGELAAAEIPEPPAWIELRARLLGDRRGLLLEIGADEPLELPVVTVTRAKEERAILQRVRRAERPLPLVGFVGLEARAGTNARARVVVGAGANLASLLELDVAVSVGPSFAAPSALADSGPFTLGFELALRVYTRPATVGTLAPYAEVFGAVDARLPGVDAGGGARAGVAFRFTEAVTIDAAFGGAVTAFNLTNDSPDAGAVGFTGGVRVVVRFGAAPEGSR